MNFIIHKKNKLILLLSFYLIFVLSSFSKLNLSISFLLVSLPFLIILSKKPEYIFYITFISIYFLDWFSLKLNILPRQFAWFPEVASVILILHIYKKRIIDSHIIKYLILLLIVSVLSFIYEENETAYIYMAGIRIYFKYFPFFFLPLVLEKERYDKIKKNLIKIILFIGFLQFPVSLFQRFFFYRDSISGDLVGGTLGLNASGALSQFLFFVFALLLSMNITNRISKDRTIILSAILLFPVSLNETKISIIYFIIILIIYVLIRVQIKFYKKVFIIALGLFLIIMFNNIYKKIYNNNSYDIILNYMQAPEEMIYRNWLAEGSALDRIPQVIFAYNNIKQDFFHLMWGVGIGNASESFQDISSGIYFKKFFKYRIDSIYLARYIWEWGLIGIIIWIFIFFYILKKANHTKNNLYSLWFMGVFAVFTISTIYSNNILTNVLGYFFWTLGGIVCREYYEEKKETSYYKSNSIWVSS